MANELRLDVNLVVPGKADDTETAHVEQLLADAGLPVSQRTTQLRESAEVGPDVFWIIVSVITPIAMAAGYVAKKIADPSLERLGEVLRDRLFEAGQALETRAPEVRIETWVEFRDEEGKPIARYWLPHSPATVTSLNTMIDHFAANPTGDLDRRWYDGVGWVDDKEMWERIHGTTMD